MNFIIKTMKKLWIRLKNKYLWIGILTIISIVIGFIMLVLLGKMDIWVTKIAGIVLIIEGASYGMEIWFYYLKNKKKKFRSVPLPDVLHNKSGYPTEKFLSFIRNYTPKVMPIFDFLIILKNEWYASNWGFKMHNKYDKKRKLELHTGGWSGNEELIQAIKANPYLTSFTMKYVSWKTGGHFYFEIPC